MRYSSVYSLPHGSHLGVRGMLLNGFMNCDSYRPLISGKTGGAVTCRGWLAIIKAFGRRYGKSFVRRSNDSSPPCPSGTPGTGRTVAVDSERTTSAWHDPECVWSWLRPSLVPLSSGDRSCKCPSFRGMGPNASARLSRGRRFVCPQCILLFTTKSDTKIAFFLSDGVTPGMPLDPIGASALT